MKTKYVHGKFRATSIKVFHDWQEGGGVEWAGLINIGLLVVEYHHLTICSPSVELISHKTLSSSLTCKISFHGVESCVKFNLLIKCLKGDILIQYGCHVYFFFFAVSSHKPIEGLIQLTTCFSLMVVSHYIKKLITSLTPFVIFLNCLNFISTYF